MDHTDIAQKRSIVFSARIQFAPEAQPLRETAIDKIMEQNLLIADCEEGITIGELEKQGALCLEDGSPAISLKDMKNSIERLVSTGRVDTVGVKKEHHYRLREEARQELADLWRSAERRFHSVVDRLFEHTKESPSAYSKPFLTCLCIIFSRLGETYVRLIKGEISPDELLRSPSVIHALEDVRKAYPLVNHAAFKRAVFTFFGESDPDYDAIKWNMAQNHYLAKALGLDPSGHLLSKEVFSNAVFYLDTNVAIHALNPEAKHHRSFKTLSKACEQLQIQLNICQISIDELRRALQYQREIIEKVGDQIPHDMEHRIRGDFFHMYREQLESSGRVNFDQLFLKFYNAREELSREYNVALIDDPWFNCAEKDSKTEEVVKAVKYQYAAARKRAKSPSSAMHDALLLRWTQSERKGSSKNTWIVTIDTSLPNVPVPEESRSATRLAITLDALLQWISPIAVRGNPEEEFSLVFAQALKYMLLPQETFFEMRDFFVFAEMEWSCKELPADDVETCIEYMRTKAAGLDMSIPEDREKIAHELKKFFADPGRKFKQELQRLEDKIGLVQQEVKLKIGEIQTLKGQLSSEEASHQRDVLRASGRFRLFIVFLLSVAVGTTIVYLAGKHAEGTNFFQKMVNSWSFLSGVSVVIFVLLSWLIVGKKRLLALGWPFSKFLKVDGHKPKAPPANNSEKNLVIK